MRYRRIPIEVDSPEETGYGAIACNLAESPVADACLDELGVDLRGLLLRYGDHRGLPELRELIAADAGRPLPPDATPLDPADVLVTSVAAGALFIVATALLEPGDELLVVRPTAYTSSSGSTARARMASVARRTSANYATFHPRRSTRGPRSTART